MMLRLLLLFLVPFLENKFYFTVAKCKVEHNDKKEDIRKDAEEEHYR